MASPARGSVFASQSSAGRPLARLRPSPQKEKEKQRISQAAEEDKQGSAAAAAAAGGARAEPPPPRNPPLYDLTEVVQDMESQAADEAMVAHFEVNSQQAQITTLLAMGYYAVSKGINSRAAGFQLHTYFTKYNIAVDCDLQQEKPPAAKADRASAKERARVLSEQKLKYMRTKVKLGMWLWTNR
jgi:hypothetical protein